MRAPLKTALASWAPTINIIIIILLLLTLSELIAMNLSGDRRDNNRWEHGNKKPHYQTYACYHPPHVVYNELEIHAGYKVIAANTTTDTFVWTLHKPWGHITAGRQQYTMKVFKFA